MNDTLEPRIADMLERVLRCAIVGDPAKIAEGLSNFIAAHRPDEIMVTAQIFDPAARRKSYDILSEIHPPGRCVLDAALRRWPETRPAARVPQE